MRLNTIKPNKGSRPVKQRKGKGHASGLGKTSGKGHKGQKARSGGYHKVGFEGGQMPLQRRVPKRGFRSRTKNYTHEINLSHLSSLEVELIDIEALKNANIVPRFIQNIKVIATGDIKKPVIIQGFSYSANARKAIEEAGGEIRD
ncbi:MAG: 50S ribosomal protein L15 [Gammaproteobacteria bacterium]|jgi:large subunit ribosomal protein L15|nr:50S ribosomal protein L15 [Gammaproteobacteria bacterium]MBT5216373.1 50S ribosomal protein L15 [Gammaproteobacteria bacterium]MBT5542647.1 50S ribosomal protein L15 [Gammaproteobacteria bacterium]MBT6073996.1 50S ribosomal protein L15 [Gammaproteobacteria bacterium]MDG2434859.1 50S ribosomal protein L15 [Gammaproteobacteria bacterium]